MNYKNILTLGLFCTLSAGAAFLIGAKKPAQPAPPQNPVAEILNLSGDQTQNINQDDPKFEEEIKTLSQNLETERHKLMELLTSKDAQADAIKAQLEKTLAADAEIERRVIGHLLIMRQHLNPSQSQQLMNLCDQCMCKKNGMGKGKMHPGNKGAANTPLP